MTRFTEEWLAQRLKQKKPAPAKIAVQPKYRNRKTTIDGVTFDSAKEARRWQDLQLWEKAGILTDLSRQVPFAIVINDMLICQYVADAVYKRDGVRVVEDTKSEITRRLPVYKLKKKLLKAVLNIEIQEV